MITGINHITLSTRSLEQSFTFYTQVLGLRPVAKWPAGAYLLAGETWIALVLDEAARRAPLPEYSHIAFGVDEANFAELVERIIQSGAKIWQENETEGASLYFVDPDGHKLEIHTSDLATRLRTAIEAPWAGLEFFPMP
jgi:catechol 2,3-dioxygenase-like lactoylglutathione lyase family enzyme